MSLFKNYLHIHKRFIICALIFLAVFLVTFWLYDLPLLAVLYPSALCLVIGIIFLSFSFVRYKREYTALSEIVTVTDAALCELVVSPTIKNEQWSKAMKAVISSHNDFSQQTKERYNDMIAYYTVWAHQIKTPIASMRLILQGEDSELSRSASAELFRIEQYVEMVLAFLRLGSETTDYVFSSYRIDDIVKQAARKFRGEFIMRKLSLELELTDVVVTTDEKWLSFVVEQILSNALKYTKSGKITIKVTDDGILSISDTGIGILEEDMPRIFDNGYTGKNGRLDKTSSGIGLYLCKRVCKNLSHKIYATSKVSEGTTVFIDMSQKTGKREFLQKC